MRRQELERQTKHTTVVWKVKEDHFTLVCNENMMVIPHIISAKVNGKSTAINDWDAALDLAVQQAVL